MNDVNQLQNELRVRTDTLVSLYRSNNLQLTTVQKVQILQALGHDEKTIGKVLGGKCHLSDNNQIICSADKES